MHIAFIDIAASYHAQSPLEGPLGGTQAAVCYLSVELTRQGAAVSLINQHRTLSEQLGVANLPPEVLDDAFTLRTFTHLVFNGRWTEKIIRSLRPRLKAPFIGWMHEACFQSPYILPLDAFNGMVFVSHWQRNLNAQIIPRTTRAEVIPNGIAPGFQDLHAEKSPPPVAVYAGSSKRGLLHLPEIIPLIHAAHPDLRFEIYSDGVVAAGEEENRLFREKIRALPGVTHMGAVDQSVLPARFARASYFLSPNAYPETFCIALAEAMAAGLRIIATARAALPETANGFAALMPYDHPNEPSWRPQDLKPEAFAEFASAEITRWKNLPAAEKAAQLEKQMAFAQTRYDWASHAGAWLDYLGALEREA